MHRTSWLGSVLVFPAAFIGGVTGCSTSAGAPSSTPGDSGAGGTLEWVWVPFPDAKCRDGSTAGIEVSANPASDNLMIYLEGGGSCWNPVGCSSNPATFVPPAPFAPLTGVFDRTNPENPIKDWNMVYVPYCTGDVHAGNNPGFDPGIGPQQFVGYSNLEKFLDHLVPTFPNVRKVLYTGFSAGGYGAVLTVELVRKRYPSSVDVVLIADSAPGLSLSFLPACIQHEKWTTWSFDTTLLEACGADCPNPDDYLIEYPKHLLRTYPDLRIGHIETVADATIRAAFGYGADDCNAEITQAPPPMDEATFQAGLLDFRAQMTGPGTDGVTPNFGTFYLPGTQHGWLTIGDSLYTGSAGGERLVDWFSAIVAGEAPTNVGP